MLFKKTLLLAAVICLFQLCITAQISPPYSQDFDVNSIGWTHYAINGQDDWQLGTPAYSNQNASYSAPNCWATNLTGPYSANSTMCLESPSFDLSAVAQNQVLSFYHRRDFNIDTYGRVEYSIDGGLNWLILFSNNASLIKNWYSTNSGFTWSGGFQQSCFSLAFLTGEADVRFRFLLTSLSPTSAGWLIDNFSIGNELYNAAPIQCDTITNFSEFMPNFVVSTDLYYQNQYSSSFANVINYYFSSDNIFDVSDSLIGSFTVNQVSSFSSYNQTFNTPANIHSGYYYIFIQTDVNNVLAEYNETDNMCYATLKVDSTLTAPYIDDFEDSLSVQWRAGTIAFNCSVPPYWSKGYGYRHHLEGAHSDSNAWHTSDALIHYVDDYCGGFVETPFLDISTISSPVMCFWYKNFAGGSWLSSYDHINYSTDGTTPSLLFHTIPLCTNDEWDYIVIPLTTLAGQSHLKFAFETFVDTGYFGKEGLIFDDFYIGSPLPDLSIEGNKNNRFTTTNTAQDTIHYRFSNSGIGAANNSTTSFYWSTDSIRDAGDVFIGNKIEASPGDTQTVWTSFTYTKPTLTVGEYYIFYVVDTFAVVTEMREYNNRGTFIIKQQNTLSLPYTNDFETQINDWYHESSFGVDDWNWSSPTSTALSPAFSGTKAWITNAHGDSLSVMSRFHLYTPTFDFTTLNHPVIEFDLIHKPWTSYTWVNAGANISYSIDGGASWIVLDTTNQSFKEWYYPESYEDYGGVDRIYYLALTNQYMTEEVERVFVPTDKDYQTRDTRKTTHFALDISFLLGQKNVQFRFNYGNFDSYAPGTLIDNFSISEATVDFTILYQKNLMWSSQANKIRFYTDFLNNGNARSASTSAHFFFSTDSLLDGSDVQLGSASVPELRPEYSHLLNLEFNMPVNASAYQYLLIVCDSNNTILESDETNNIIAWSLGLDSNIVFPYFNDFSAAQIDGWTWYHNDPFNQTYNGYRFRHKTIVGEGHNVYDAHTDEWFLDRINSNISNYSLLPTYFLETPVFDFSSQATIVLDFDILCIGQSFSNSSGGNMEYSVDGGTTWQLLDNPQVTNTQNWYNLTNIGTLNGNPGWYFTLNEDFVPCFADVSFLAGQPAVKFRYVFKSAFRYSYPGRQGFRLDNFQVTTTPVGVPDNSSSPQLSFFNQNGVLTASISSPTPMQNALVEIYDASGRLVYTQTSDLGSGLSVIPLTGNLNDGIYFLNISHANQNFHARTCFVK
ncbi:MAG: CARDB domain-containing protein [Bacteroidia bacterium]